MRSRSFGAKADPDYVSTYSIEEHEQLVSDVERLLRSEGAAAKRLADPSEALRADELLDAAGDLDELEQQIEEDARGPSLVWIQLRPTKRAELDSQRRRLDELRALAAGRELSRSGGLDLGHQFNSLLELSLIHI